MKITLGLLICFVLIIMGTVMFAPEYAHDIIDMFHDKSTIHTAQALVTKRANENGTSGTDNSDIIVVPRVPVIGVVVESENEHSNSRDDNGPATPIQAIPTQTSRRSPNEQQLLERLKAQGYRVEEGQVFYRISWHMQSPSSSQPVSICLKNNGTIIPNYGRRPASNLRSSAGGKVTINGSTITTYHGGVDYTVSNGGLDISLGSGAVTVNTPDKVTITSSAKYENGSWWFEITRSFLWFPGQDSTQDVWSKAKQIKNN